MTGAAAMNWLWEPHNLLAWLGAMTGQFLVFVVFLTPLLKRLLGWPSLPRLVADWLNPDTPGGSGSLRWPGHEPLWEKRLHKKLTRR